MKTRRSQKTLDKSLQKTHMGFRLNPYFEQKDFQCLKPKNKADHPILSIPQSLKRSRGRPPKKRQQTTNDASKSNNLFMRF